MTASVGVAQAGEKASTPAELIALADSMLYQAKKAGRDRVEAYDGGKGA